MPKAWSTSVLPSGAASCGQAVRSGSLFPSLTSATATAPCLAAAPTDVIGASLAHALASAATATSNERPNHRVVVFLIIVLLVCGIHRVEHVRLHGGASGA